MPATLRVFDRHFALLEEFGSIEFSERNWMLSGIGQASFKVSIKDTKTKRNIIRPGNMVRIHSTLGCPDWVGRIDKFQWENDDSITVSCNSREALLDGIAFEGKITSTHDIATIIDGFMSDPNTRLSGIHVGHIYSATLDEADTINASGKFTDALNSLATALDAEWMVHPDTGRLDFVKQIGVDRSHDVVIEQANDLYGFPNVVVDTSNLIWFCKVQAPGEKAEEIRFGEYWDEEIRNWLGGDVRQRILHESSTLRESTLEQKAKAEVEKSLKEIFTFDFTINQERKLLKKHGFWIGDTITVNFPTIAWRAHGKVRVVGVGVDEATGSTRLVCKPINPRHWFRHFSGI